MVQLPNRYRLLYNFNIKVVKKEMQDSIISFESGNAKSRRTLPSSRLTSHIQAAIEQLQEKEVSLWDAIDRLKESGTVIRRETRKALQELKEEAKDKIQDRVNSVEDVLRTLDGKIQFVVESCDKYIESINTKLQEFNKHKGSDEKQRLQIHQSSAALSQRLQFLEQKAIKWSDKQRQLKKHIEVLKQQNICLNHDRITIVSKSNEFIENLQRQSIQKDQQLLQREHIINTLRETIGQKNQQFSQLAQVIQQQKSRISQQEIILQQNKKPIVTQQPQIIVQVTPQVIGLKQSVQNVAAPIQNLMQFSNVTAFNSPREPQHRSSPIGMLKESSLSSVAAQSRMTCNGYEIKPEFFKFGDSQLKKQNEITFPKGINVRSINRQDSTGTGITIKKYKQLSDTGNQHKHKKDETHRFGYLLNNLAIQTQTNIFEDYKESTVSEQSHGTLMFYPK